MDFSEGVCQPEESESYIRFLSECKLVNTVRS